jgi:hypothetical protein
MNRLLLTLLLAGCATAPAASLTPDTQQAARVEFAAALSQIDGTAREQLTTAKEQTTLLAQLRMYFADNSFADGVTNYRGGMALVGERGPELVNLPRGSSVTPNHQLGGGTVQNFHFNLSGMVGDKSALARMIRAAFIESSMNQGARVVARA